jgi:hypothetical protein
MIATCVQKISLENVTEYGEEPKSNLKWSTAHGKTEQNIYERRQEQGEQSRGTLCYVRNGSHGINAAPTIGRSITSSAF